MQNATALFLAYHRLKQQSMHFLMLPALAKITLQSTPVYPVYIHPKNYHWGLHYKGLNLVSTLRGERTETHYIVTCHLSKGS